MNLWVLFGCNKNKNSAKVVSMRKTGYESFTNLVHQRNGPVAFSYAREQVQWQEQRTKVQHLQQLLQQLLQWFYYSLQVWYEQLSLWMFFLISRHRQNKKKTCRWWRCRRDGRRRRCRKWSQIGVGKTADIFQIIKQLFWHVHKDLKLGERN